MVLGEGTNMEKLTKLEIVGSVIMGALAALSTLGMIAAYILPR